MILDKKEVTSASFLQLLRPKERRREEESGERLNSDAVTIQTIHRCQIRVIHFRVLDDSQDIPLTKLCVLKFFRNSFSDFIGYLFKILLRKLGICVA